MRILTVAALAAFALALSTIGCSADAQDDGVADESSDLTAHKHEVVATDADNGKTVKVTEGDTFVLKLGSNATTGYKWKVAKTDRTFAYPFADDYKGPGSGGPVGAGGTQVMKWSTDAVSDAHGTPVMSKVGKHSVTVEYRRPWEPAETCAGSSCSPTPAARTFKLTIEVVAPATEPTDPDESLCGETKCGAGQSCQFCWGAPACVPHGAMC